MKLIFAALFLFIAPAQEAEILIQMRDGTSLNASQVQFLKDRIRIDSGERTKELAFDELSSLRFSESTANRGETFRVALVDGSMIVCDRLVTVDNKLELSVGESWNARISPRNVDWIDLQKGPNQSFVERESQWRKLLLSRPAAADALVVKREGSMEYFEGVVGEIGPERIEFSTDERTANVKRDRLSGLVFYRADGRDLAEANCQLETQGGSMLSVSTVTTEGDRLRMLLACGDRLDLPSRMVLSGRFGIGREVFLTDEEPATVDWKPLIAGKAIESALRKVRLPRLNESYSGRKLSLRYFSEPGLSTHSELVRYDHGVAVSGGSKLAFVLDKKYKSLSGTVGFAPNASENGCVKLVIRADGAILFEKVLENSEFRNPIDLDLDVSETQRITIDVEYHDRRAIGDRLHLCDLKVTK